MLRAAPNVLLNHSPLTELLQVTQDYFKQRYMNRSIATAQFSNISNATESYKVNITVIIRCAYNFLIWKTNNYIQYMQAVTTTQMFVSHAGNGLPGTGLFFYKGLQKLLKMLKYGGHLPNSKQ